MKTPSLPKTIKPFDIVAAVKRALKKADANNEEETPTHELDRLHNLFIINAWAADFGHEPKSVSGEFYWTPGTSSGAFERYRSTLSAACKCAEWNLRYPSSEQNKALLEFYGKFNVVDGISRLLFEKATESKCPEHKGIRIEYKAVSYKFGGDIMKDVPTEYKFQFDIGSDHYMLALSDDYKQLTFSGKSTKTIKVEEFAAELDSLINATNSSEFVDLASI